MPTLTKIWSFASSAEGWTLSTGGATGITGGWTGSDNATGDTAGTGCLYTRRTGQNLSDGFVRWYITLKGTDLGLPPNAVITRMAARAWGRCAVYSTGSSSTSITDPYIYNARIGYIRSLPNNYWWSYSGTTSWAQLREAAGWSDLLATETFDIFVETQPVTGNSSSAQVELRIDRIELTVDYVVPDTEPKSAPTVKIGNTDITSYVAAGSIRIERFANGNNSECSFECNVTGWTNPLGSLLVLDASVEVKGGTIVLFSGNVASVSVTSKGGHVRYSVRCQDAAARLVRVVVPYVVYNNTTVGAIVASLVANYSGGVISTDISYVNDTRPVSSYSFQAMTLLDALKTIASAYPAAWYLDTQKRLHWRYVSQPEHSGYRFAINPTLYDGGVALDSVNYERDIAGLANHITVISQYDQYNTTNYSYNVSTAGDDGYLTGTSTTTWPPTNASSVNTSSSQIVVKKANEIPKITSTLNPSTVYRPGLYGDTWPPTTPYTHNENFVKELAYTSGSPRYYCQTLGFRFNIPSSWTGLGLISLIFDVSNVGDHPGDTINQIWVERTDQGNAQTAITEPPSFYSALLLQNATNVIAITTTASPGDSLYFRIGLRTGAPALGALNQAQITNVRLTVERDDPNNAFYEEKRALLRFDTSPIPDSATINSVQLKLRCVYRNGTIAPNLVIRKVTSNIWPLDTSDWDYAVQQDVLAVVSFASISPGQDLIVSLPVSCVNVTGYTQLALHLDQTAAPGSYEFAELMFAAHGTSNAPNISVVATTFTAGVSFTAQDTASQGQYGMRKLVIYNPGYTADDCAKRAQLELARRAVPVEELTIKAFNGIGIYAGQAVWLDLGAVLSADNRLVLRSTIEYVYPTYKYTLKLIGLAPRLESLIAERL